jgi:hypothetical protein
MSLLIQARRAGGMKRKPSTIFEDSGIVQFFLSIYLLNGLIIIGSEVYRFRVKTSVIFV